MFSRTTRAPRNIVTCAFRLFSKQFNTLEIPEHAELVWVCVYFEAAETHKFYRSLLIIFKFKPFILHDVFCYFFSRLACWFVWSASMAHKTHTVADPNHMISVKLKACHVIHWSWLNVNQLGITTASEPTEVLFFCRADQSEWGKQTTEKIFTDNKRKMMRRTIQNNNKPNQNVVVKRRAKKTNVAFLAPNQFIAYRSFLIGSITASFFFSSVVVHDCFQL